MAKKGQPQRKKEIDKNQPNLIKEEIDENPAKEEIDGNKVNMIKGNKSKMGQPQRKKK